MGSCSLCHQDSSFISRALGVCLSCLRNHAEQALPVAAGAHRRSRAAFGLPEVPPRDPQGIPCALCLNECRISENQRGFCGLRANLRGGFVGATAERGKLSWYHDPLPTNCVADWVCPAGTGCGYPRYAHRPGAERGYYNLAVFFQACSFDCLFCQNWHFRRETLRAAPKEVEHLVSQVDARTSCICYFGGDPSPQLPFSLEASRLALQRTEGRILRVCWETNGSMAGALLEKTVDVALSSGGCVKFDLKSWDESLHVALTGVSNRQTLENFRRAGRRIAERPVPPLLVASTLLVPGYIDEQEVSAIAGFIASVDPGIPYSLLGFHPCFEMSDLPVTPRELALSCQVAAREAGLQNVHIGNRHLLI